MTDEIKMPNVIDRKGLWEVKFLPYTFQDLFFYSNIPVCRDIKSFNGIVQ